MSPLTVYTKYTPLLSGVGKKCKVVLLSFTLFLNVFYCYLVEKYVYVQVKKSNAL